MGAFDDILEAAGKVIKTSADPLDTLKMRRIPQTSDTILELITGKNKCSEPVAELLFIVIWQSLQNTRGFISVTIKSFI